MKSGKIAVYPVNLTIPDVNWTEIILRVQLNSDFEQTRSAKQIKYTFAGLHNRTMKV